MIDDNQALKELSDEELMHRVQEDDAAAFEELVERYQHCLNTYIARFLGSGSHVEDILQETFIRVWRHRSRYKTIARFSTWVYTIAGNLSKTELRRQRVRRSVPIKTGGESRDDEAVDVVDETARTDDQVRRNEIRRTVSREIARLPDVYRGAVILRDVQDRSYDEIAGILNVPVGTVKSKVHRGRAILQKRLSPLLDLGEKEQWNKRKRKEDR